MKTVPCNKGGYHQGEPITMICTNPECSNSNKILCCTICVQQFHAGHQTKSLKKFIIDAQQKDAKSKDSFQVKPSFNNISSSPKKKLNTDIISNMMLMTEKQIKEKFDNMKQSLKYTLDKIQASIENYFKNVLQRVLEKNQGQNSIQFIIQNVNSANSVDQLQNYVKKLMLLMETDTCNDQFLSQSELIDAMNISNLQIDQFIEKKLGGLVQTLNSYEKAFVLQTSGHNLSEKSFTFSNIDKNPYVQIINSFQAKGTGQNGYKFAIMNPSVENKGNLVSLSFKPKVTSAEWMAFGFCHINTIRQKKYTFDYSSNNHGAYMISSNAGSWHSSNENFNNKVLAFNFKKDQQVSCILNMQTKKIIFLSKDSSYTMNFQLKHGNPLHPCVVFYYKNDVIQYLPKIFSGSSPRYLNKFSNISKSNSIKLLSNYQVMTTAQGYQMAVMQNDLQKSMNPVECFAFRIDKASTQNPWIGVGICHKKVVQNKNFSFDYGNKHGTYMISTNGGSWSHLQKQNNNILKSFKFAEGDTILIKIDFWNRRVIFKKKQEIFSLRIEQQQGDPLCPCVCFHFTGDAVSFLPQYNFDY